MVSANLEIQPLNKQLDPALPGQKDRASCPMTCHHLEKESRKELAPQKALLLADSVLFYFDKKNPVGPIIMKMIQRSQACLTPVPSLWPAIADQPQETGCQFLDMPGMFMPPSFCSTNSFCLDVLYPHSFPHIQLKCQLLKLLSDLILTPPMLSSLAELKQTDGKVPPLLQNNTLLQASFLRGRLGSNKVYRDWASLDASFPSLQHREILYLYNGNRETKEKKPPVKNRAKREHT